MRLYIDIIVILLGLQVLAASAITCTYKGKTLENLDYAYHENGCTQLQCQFGQMEAVTEACSKEIDGICHPVGAIFDYNEIEYQCLKTEEGGIVSYEIEQLTPVFKPCQAEGKTFQHLQKFMLSDGCILYQCQDGNVTIINPACPKDTNGICHELGYWFEQGGQYYVCQNRSENGVEVFENKLLDPQPNVKWSCNKASGERYATLETFLTPNGCREVQCQAGKFAYLTSRCRDNNFDTCRYVGELWDYADDHFQCQLDMGSNGLPAWWARKVSKTYQPCWVSETSVPHLGFWQNPSRCIKTQCIDDKLLSLEIGCHLSNNKCKSMNDMWSVEGIVYKCVVTSTGYRKVVIVDANGNYDDSEPNIDETGVVFPEFEGCPAVADIIFVMDASRSINPTNFAIQLDFVSNISNYFVIGPNDVQFGAVVFSDIAKKLFDLNDHTTAAKVEEALRDTPYLRNITHTEKALNMIIDDGMFEAAAGGRDNADDVVIVLTDGRSEDTPTTIQAADRLKARGVNIIVVGITLMVYDPELQGIATRQENVFRAPGYEVIQSILNAVSRRACDTVNNCKGDPCEHKCTGNDTGFVCSCRDGYVLNEDDNTRCDDIDECSDPALSPCDQICTNTEGGFECSCKQGYNVSSSDPAKCEDKNECADTDQPVCEHDCENTVGGYTCSCQPGYEVSPTDPSKCVDKNECETEAPCQQTCTNTPGSYRCSCETGYVVSSTDPDLCEDIDECQEGSPCEQTCTNTEGSYECSCQSGYRVSSTDPSQCDDIDECQESSPCDQTCTNTEGSYQCSCETGYVISPTDPNKCDDIDECQEGSPCEQVCTNTEGSYQCSCQPGYSVSSSDSSQCDDIDECQNPSTCEHTCTNTEGSFECSCDPGYVVSPNNPTKCNDINECENGEAQCEQVCTNLKGSYKCSCNEGYVVDPNDTTKCNEIIICKTKADIILVFDASSSIGREDYDKQYVFAKRLIRHFTIGADDVRFASVVFSYSVKRLFNLNKYNSYAGLDAALTGVPYESMSTYTHKALKDIMDYKMFDPINGGRADALDVVVLLTDGNANRQSSTVQRANELKAMGVVIMGILIGPEPEPEMFAEIVSSPDDIIPATSYDELDYIEQKVADRTCHESTTKAPVP